MLCGCWCGKDLLQGAFGFSCVCISEELLIGRFFFTELAHTGFLSLSLSLSWNFSVSCKRFRGVGWYRILLNCVRNKIGNLAVAIQLGVDSPVLYAYSRSR